MTEDLISIPNEPSVLKLPSFANNVSKFCFTTSPSALHLSNTASISSINTMSMDSSPHQSQPACDCPHILVADDEPFELFYYQHLFQKSLSLSTLRKQQLRIQTFNSGEDLIAFYGKHSTCECNSISLIITDYNMGTQNLDGISTVTILRKLGYKGHLVLRTSETKEQLMKGHKDLEALLEKSVVYINKSDLQNTKQILQRLIDLLHLTHNHLQTRTH